MSSYFGKGGWLSHTFHITTVPTAYTLPLERKYCLKLLSSSPKEELKGGW